jgi:ADP-heptose:LPS heptosyltransferase
MDQEKPNLYTIKGGIGKCAAFTPLINKLAQKDGKKIAVASGYPGVFNFHPQVSGTLKTITPEGIKPVVDQFDNIIMREPYVSNYIKGDRHILDEWANLYDLEPFDKGGYYARPDLVLGEMFLSQAEQLKTKLPKPFFIVQWTGGQPPNNFKNNKKYPDNYLTKARNVKNYQDIMLTLAEAYPEHIFLVFALPNEPVQMPESIRPRIARAKAHALAFAGLLKYADGFIALDSSLQHFAASEQISKKGVVLWGHKTTPETIGYNFHSNLTSSEADTVYVEPIRVIDALTAIERKGNSAIQSE